MCETLCDLVGLTPNPIVRLRMEADRACKKLAEQSNADPEKLWSAAMNNQLERDIFMCDAGMDFWESFTALNRAEVAEIETRRLTALQ